MAVILNKIVIGDDLENPILTFENETENGIQSISMETAVSLIGEELFIDTLTPVVKYTVWIPYIFKPTNAAGFMSRDGKILASRMNYDLRKLPYGTKITYFADDETQGGFYCQKVERTAESWYKISAISAIGLMDKQYHVGGIYTGQPFSDVLREIVGDEYEYTVDGIVATQRVFGWLPYSTRRRNLYQLIMAYGVNIIKGNNGNMFFTFLDGSDPEEVPTSRVFAGGTVVYNDPASRVEVTEHSYHYVAEVDDEVLFDNTADEAVEHSLITFDQPIYPGSVYVENGGNITIHQIGVNHAYISGMGILKGKPYTHTQRILHAENESAQSEKVVKVEDATLVTLMNSENVLGRMAQYYFHATTVKQDIVVEGERTGGRYIMRNAFHELLTGFISRMSTRVSSFNRATCEIIQNYTPIGQGSAYTDSVIVPLNTGANAVWSVPDSVKAKDSPTVRVVLIGFGEDGQKGANGEQGTSSTQTGAGKGGAGGEGGKGGAGGKVLIITLDATALNSITLYNSGRNSMLTAGDLQYSSADGAPQRYGYYDPYTDTSYATPGYDGQAGGKGGDGDYYTHTTGSASTAEDGESIVYNGKTYAGGKAGTRNMTNGANLGISSNLNVYTSAAAGGGAAVGRNGGDVDQTSWHTRAVGGSGADAVAADAAANVYGAGGNGGHGGGGGGASSMREYWNWVYTSLIGVDASSRSKGGTGSAGSAGKYGCAIIYF